MAAPPAYLLDDIEAALAEVKAVRRRATVCIQVLARVRDQLETTDSPKEDTRNGNSHKDELEEG